VAGFAVPAAAALVARAAAWDRGRLIGGLRQLLPLLALLELALGLRKPAPATLAGAEPLGQLVAARLAVELVLDLVDAPCLGDDLARDPLVVEVRLAARVRGDLGPVDRHYAGPHQPSLRAEREHGAKQLAQGDLVADDEAGDRRVVRDPVGRDHPVGDVLAAMDLDRPRGALLSRVGVENQGDHHRGLTRGGAVPVGAVVGVERPEVHVLDGGEHEPDEVVLRQPLAQPGRHQKDLLTAAFDEVAGHGEIVFATPDGAGLCDSLHGKGGVCSRLCWALGLRPFRACREPRPGRLLPRQGVGRCDDCTLAEPLRRVTRLSAQLARLPTVHRRCGLSGFGPIHY
jgi:hypothetical protein